MGAIVCQLRKAHLTPALGGRNMSCHMVGHMFRHMLKEGVRKFVCEALI